ncbi:MAG: translesion DNA synthesis-associated protein ImuA [Burkholderiales bacterium]
MKTLLADILARHSVWRGGALAPLPAPAVPTGFAALDRELPGGGWPSGALTEILGLHEGVGELQLVLPALVKLSRRGRRIVWLAPPHLPYAPALAAAGIDLAQLSVVRAPGRRDALWAAEQVLRAGSCDALIAWFRDIRYPELRRLAVAAETSRVFCALFRRPEVAPEPSPACLRIALEPVHGGITVRLLKRRGALAAAPVFLPLKRPVHAVGGPALSFARARSPVARPCPA